MASIRVGLRGAAFMGIAGNRPDHAEQAAIDVRLGQHLKFHLREPSLPRDAIELAADFRYAPCPTGRFNHCLPFCSKGLHYREAPIAFDRMRQSTGYEHALELPEGRDSVANVNDRVACGDAIKGRVG